MSASQVHTGVVILGGGVTGLWLLDDLRRRGIPALLIEAEALGAGQTVAAQGIIHGGLKYTLGGRLTDAARSIRDMPGLWRRCLEGTEEPDLRATRRRADTCMIWRTRELSSRLGMIGARFGLRVAPRTIEREDRPRLLRSCPGAVAALDEQVIDPASMLGVLAARNGAGLVRADGPASISVRCEPTLGVEVGCAGRLLEVRGVVLVLAAGAGNQGLRAQLGLDPGVMQRRPLHMTVVRQRKAGAEGVLQAINGHCIDGARTRVTITSEVDEAGRVTWQVGGEVSEVGVAMQPEELVRHVRSELLACLPDLHFGSGQVEWSTYRVDRAEARTADGRRPDVASILEEGPVITAWPTKMVLAPAVAAEIAARLPDLGDVEATAIPATWARPEVAAPPWREATWMADDSL
ncbi:MAG: FAD-dependent oxidoreductase [Phycisphaerales bacterium]|nr:FAD-dependent oxidoreductase [Phycisphaerales bacterium]